MENAASSRSRVVTLCAVALLALPGRALTGQTLTVTSNTLVATITPVVSDFTNASNAGRTFSAGSVTLSITNCPKNKKCTIDITGASSSNPSSPSGPPLAWTVPPDAGIPDDTHWGACLGGSGSVSATASTVFSCSVSGNGTGNRTSIVVTFTRAVSWFTTPGANPSATFSTTGITFRLTVS